MATRVRVFRQSGAIRVTIPKRIWEAMGSPKEFELTIEGDRIVLKPVRS